LPDKGPNILLLTTDQQRYDTIAALGNRHIRTPALDRLCAEGTAFRRAYCTNPLCSPSRASILTGLMPSQHRCWNVGVGLPEDARTLPSLLRSAGYTSANRVPPAVAPPGPRRALADGRPPVRRRRRRPRGARRHVAPAARAVTVRKPDGGGEGV
jgi:hypothetical protein